MYLGLAGLMNVKPYIFRTMRYGWKWTQNVFFPCSFSYYYCLWKDVDLNEVVYLLEVAVYQLADPVACLVVRIRAEVDYLAVSQDLELEEVFPALQIFVIQVTVDGERIEEAT